LIIAVGDDKDEKYDDKIKKEDKKSLINRRLKKGGLDLKKEKINKKLKRELG
jgi:hypothetical protein